MQKLLQLLEYNFWANDQFISRLKDQPGLPEEIDKLFSHILQAHIIWLKRIYKQENTPHRFDLIPREQWETLNISLYNETTNVLKSRSIDEFIVYHNSKGLVYQNCIGDIMYHIIHHSTHHRAQVALLMRHQQILPPASDYIFYLRK